ncbi:MAG TPA: RNA polymerase sigma-70 factor [Flavisolibacter sp.]|jgi:RNA polymerase sigma-70 factor (ECF subfamily)|nr:RNA polymerase sigma-70 factor [Flavisolibacter sp.]
MTAPSLISKLVDKIALYDDTSAYKELFLTYHPKLVSFSMTITHSRELAEEVVSDAFMKIWVNRSSLKRVENFHLYLYVITKNLSINAWLKKKREKTFSIEDTVVEFRSIYLDPEQMLITAEMYKRLHLAIKELPPKCQLIFKLVKEDGLKYREVAELLNLSQKTIENQMTIALRKIGQSIRFTIPTASFN